MLTTSGRLLQLLGLLQLRRSWTGPELARRLGVSTRTIRNDIEKLRELDYPIAGAPGVAGGYRLGAGTALPPLLLDDDEAVAVAVGLRTAATTAVNGIEETSVRAAAKLEQVLPARIRARVRALESAVVAVPGVRSRVAADVLTDIAGAIRSSERLRFDYVAFDGRPGRRSVEPHRLVSRGGRWYLLGWDTDRFDWRTFRVDRMTLRTPTGPRFTPRDMPDAEVVERVEHGVNTAPWTYRARVLLHAPAEKISTKLPFASGIESAGRGRCVVEVGSDNPQMLALHLGLLDVDFELLDSPELAEGLLRLADRFRRAAASEGAKG